MEISRIKVGNGSKGQDRGALPVLRVFKNDFFNSGSVFRYSCSKDFLTTGIFRVSLRLSICPLESMNSINSQDSFGYFEFARLVKSL